jgi:hypothetical protein
MLEVRALPSEPGAHGCASASEPVVTHRACGWSSPVSDGSRGPQRGRVDRSRGDAAPVLPDTGASLGPQRRVWRPIRWPARTVGHRARDRPWPPGSALGGGPLPGIRIRTRTRIRALSGCWRSIEQCAGALPEPFVAGHVPACRGGEGVAFRDQHRSDVGVERSGASSSKRAPICSVSSGSTPGCSLCPHGQGGRHGNAPGHSRIPWLGRNEAHPRRRHPERGGSGRDHPGFGQHEVVEVHRGGHPRIVTSRSCIVMRALSRHADAVRLSSCGPGFGAGHGWWRRG